MFFCIHYIIWISTLSNINWMNQKFLYVHYVSFHLKKYFECTTVAMAMSSRDIYISTRTQKYIGHKWYCKETMKIELVARYQNLYISYQISYWWITFFYYFLLFLEHTRSNIQYLASKTISRKDEAVVRKLGEIWFNDIHNSFDRAFIAQPA